MSEPGVFWDSRALPSSRTQNAKLCQQALKELDGWKAAKEFYVCTVCGYVSMDGKIKKCPVCAAPRSQFAP